MRSRISSSLRATPSRPESPLTALGQPASASCSIPAAETICPGVQYPHCKASCSTNERWSGCRFPSGASPAAVTISAPWCATARARQLFARRPSSRTVQAPHCPWSQPFLGLVIPRRSRRASSTVVRESTVSLCSIPSTRSAISTSTVIPFRYSRVPTLARTRLKSVSGQAPRRLRITRCPAPALGSGRKPTWGGGGWLGGVLSLLRRRLVDEDGDPVADHLRVGELQPLLVACLAEEALAGTQDDREDHQAQLVYQVVLDQRLDEPATAVDHDVAARRSSQPGDLLDHVASEHRRVVPLGPVERGGDDVLGHAVELVRELALPRWPGRGKSLVGHTSQQKRLGVEGLIQLELVAGLATIELEGPTAVLVVLSSTRVLHDAVERDEFGYDDPGHSASPQIEKLAPTGPVPGRGRGRSSSLQGTRPVYFAAHVVRVDIE